MLPALPSPPALLPAAPPRERWHWRALVLSVGVALMLTLSACGRLPSPPRATVLSALALQIELTQEAIAGALELPPPGAPQVSRVRIDTERGMTIGAARGLHLSGHFDWRLADDSTVVDSPFELYLQRGERGQSWRLARPVGPATDPQNQLWQIDPLPIKG